MKLACQIVWVALMAFGFLSTIYTCINGREATKPSGFVGVLVTFAIYGAGIALGFGAGVYQEFFK